MKKLIAALLLLVLTLQLAVLPAKVLNSETQENLSQNGFMVPQTVKVWETQTSTCVQSYEIASPQAVSIVKVVHWPN